MHGIIEWNNRLVRQTGPIYIITLSNCGRAHFYAPVKKLGSLSVDTYWFNLGVIWLSTLVFYILLVYDVLRMFTDWTEIRKKRKKSRM